MMPLIWLGKFKNDLAMILWHSYENEDVRR